MISSNGKWGERGSHGLNGSIYCWKSEFYFVKIAPLPLLMMCLYTYSRNAKIPEFLWKSEIVQFSPMAVRQAVGRSQSPSMDCETLNKAKQTSIKNSNCKFGWKTQIKAKIPTTDETQWCPGSSYPGIWSVAAPSLSPSLQLCFSRSLSTALQEVSPDDSKF